MKKAVIATTISAIVLLSFILGILFFGPKDILNFKKEKTDEGLCAEPFVLLGERCCLDENNDKECDKFEGELESCGDSVCSSEEDKCTCPSDCGTCGGETDATYFACENNVCVEKKKQEYCGNGVCENGETCNSCFQDCCSMINIGIDLSDYPEITNGMKSVVGNKAPSRDVQNLDIIVRALNSEDIFLSENKLSSEVADIRTANYLVIGNPCDNPLAAELMKKEVIENEGCDVFAAGEAIIKLYATSSNTVALLVAGRTPIDTKRAAEVLADYSSYHLSGTEVKVK